MKKYLILSLFVMLIGCDTNGEVKDANLPKGLSDCDVYNTDYGKVIRCPDSDTKRYVGGKTPTHNTVIVYDTNTKAEYDTVITITKKKKEPYDSFFYAIIC